MNLIFAILFFAMPYQDDAHNNYKVGFFGMTGCGKTSLALQKILSERHDFIIITDQDRQYSRRLKCFCAKTFYHFQKCLEEHGRVCFDPSGIPQFRGDMTRAFDWLAEFVWNFSGNVKGNKLWVIDDFPDYMPTKDEKYREHRICEITGNGRRRGLDLYALCRYYNEACPKFTGALSDVYAFMQPDAYCAQTVARQGFDLETLQTLRQGQYLHLDRMTGKITPGKIALPRGH